MKMFGWKRLLWLDAMEDGPAAGGAGAVPELDDPWAIDEPPADGEDTGTDNATAPTPEGNDGKSGGDAAAPDAGTQAHPESDKAWEKARKAQNEAVLATAAQLANQQMAAQQAQLDAEFARRFAGHVNPATGKPIASYRDYLAAVDAEETQRRNTQLQQAGLDPALLDNMVNNHPAIVQARQAAERSEQQQKNFERQVMLERGNKLLEEQMAAIGRLDPGVKSFEDLRGMENFGEFDRLARGGMDLVNAYKLANFDKLAGSRAAAAKQAALNAVNGKQHQQATPGGAGGDKGVEIPTDEMGVWREMFPEDSPQKLRERYNKTI